MAITYLPRMAALGIMAPVLGPWFAQGAAALPVPNAGALNLGFNLNGDWFAPAAGNLSLFVTGGTVPPALDCLRDHSGAYPFAQGGRLLAYFRLLPEVEARLHALVGLIPAASSATVQAAPLVAGAPTRPQVRSFAMLLPANFQLTAANLNALFNVQNPTGTLQEQMAALGLACDAQGNNIANGALPMTHLRRPGGSLANRDRVLIGVNGQVDFWAFDRRGRAIDPGAVACWWSWLLNTGVGNDPNPPPNSPNPLFQMLAANVNAQTECAQGTPPAGWPANTAFPLVAAFAPQLTAQLVDPHEGPLGAPFLALGGDLTDTNNKIRLTRDGTALTAGASSVLVQAGNNGTALAFTAAPTVAAGAPAQPADNPLPDNAPRPRVALLPAGSYGSTLKLWPNGAVMAGLTRDFVRVAVVDEEAFLTGLNRRNARTAPANSPAIIEQRQSDQNRPSTRINVNRTADANSVLLANSQLAANFMLALPNANNPTRMVLGISDTAWGGTPTVALPTPAAAPPAASPLPQTLNDAGAAVPTVGQYRVRALAGGGANAAAVQVVLVEINLGAACAGCFVRVWPLGFDFDSGLHFRLSGGSGCANPQGLVYAAVSLPAGKVAPVGSMLLDMLVVYPQQAAGTGVAFLRHYSSQKFTRPAPDAAAAANFNQIAAGSWVVCETGSGGTNVAMANNGMPPGAHLVLLSNNPNPALVDRTTIALANWDARTLGAALNANLAAANTMVSLTQPAFMAVPDRADNIGHPLPNAPQAPGNAGGGPGGGLNGLLTANNNSRLHLLARAPANDAASSLPYPVLERLEVAGATTSVAQQANGPAATASAVIGSAAPVPWSMEPLANHYLGYPGIPAAIEVHGSGARLSGAPAVAVAEYVLERTAGLSFAQIQGLGEPWRSLIIQSEVAVAADAAARPLPTIADGANAGPVVAVLRTCAAGMEGLPGAALAINQAGYYPTSWKVADDFYNWANNNLKLPASLPGAGAIPAAGTALQTSVTPGSNITAMCRALDRRLNCTLNGARETLTALLAAIDRAQDLIYIETPALDMQVIDPAGENINLWQRLLNRMAARPSLRLALCLPTLPAAGTPQAMREVRDHCLMDAIDAMRSAAADRFALFAPGVGAGRGLRIASTSVVIDDAIAFTGTTHLSRRGLSWDSSLAVAVFDEVLQDGRPQDVSNFRMQLMADRLGIPVTLLPIDAQELIKAIRDLDTRGSDRLSASPITRPVDTPTQGNIDAWNPDGSQTGLNFASVVTLMQQASLLTDVNHAMVEG